MTPRDPQILTKKASQHTKRANQENQEKSKQLPFSDVTSFARAKQDCTAKVSELIVEGLQDTPAWDMQSYEAFQKEGTSCPDTVHPSLWRQAQLNVQHGLYRVTEGIYQVRGYDLSVMSIIQGAQGYIIIDPLLTTETAHAAIELVYKYLGKLPITAVLYTHSHMDHFGGVKGIISEDDVSSGAIQIIAPKDFMRAAISEQVLAGNAMSRRAVYMYGALLPKSPRGQVDAGLGKTVSVGTITLIPPTTLITEPVQKMSIDGVELIFQLTPDAEAPAEYMVYLPAMQALCTSEEACHTMHNLYTPRGAQVRDAKNWAHHLDNALELFPDAQLCFASHHWPIWGKQKVHEFLIAQRDMYKYIHDQTLRLANHGLKMNEIAEQLRLPESLNNKWYNRGYYGTLNHNAKAVYQKYFGWFDGNPAHLHPLPEVESSQKYVEYMDGSDAILKKAYQDCEQGNYRWVVQAVNHIIFADPTNVEAKALQADALEQLGYQSESGPWRNFYLMGAHELRNGISKKIATQTTSPDVIRNLTLDMFFDYLSVRLNGPKAEGKTVSINWHFIDTNQNYYTNISNCIFHHKKDVHKLETALTVTLTRSLLDDILLGQTTTEAALQSGEVKLNGDVQGLHEFLSLLDAFNPRFPIVTPSNITS